MHTQVRYDSSILSEPQIELGDALRLRPGRPSDREALIAFNTETFDERVTEWTRDLLSGRHAHWSMMRVYQIELKAGVVTADFADCSGAHDASVLLDCLFPPYTGKAWVLS